MRVNKTFTVGADEINVATGLTTAAQPTDRLMAKRVFVQMLSGGSGIGYVLGGVSYGIVGDATNDSHVTAELAPAAAGSPGGSYSDSDDHADIELSKMWVHGANAGDEIKVSYDLPV